eukprot:m.20406 g.20406  ORF g.20406 m.20406 type:complete len:267 (+) comp8159_c0_seq2:124-924(+)
MAAVTGVEYVEKLRAVFARAQPSDAQEAAALVFHAFMLSYGCTPSQEPVSDGWNASDDVFKFQYTLDSQPIVMKLLKMDGSLMIHVQVEGESAIAHEQDIAALINTDCDFSRPDVCVSLLVPQVYLEFTQLLPFARVRMAAAQRYQSESETPAAKRGEPMPTTGPLPDNAPMQPDNPFRIGGADVQPNIGQPIGPGGGMYVGPDHPMFRHRHDPTRDPLRDPRFPRQGIPPGARYDPINPFGLGGMSPGPDHMRFPPGSGGMDPFL